MDGEGGFHVQSLEHNHVHEIRIKHEASARLQHVQSGYGYVIVLKIDCIQLINWICLTTYSAHL